VLVHSWYSGLRHPCETGRGKGAQLPTILPGSGGKRARWPSAMIDSQAFGVICARGGLWAKRQLVSVFAPGVAHSGRGTNSPDLMVMFGGV
jgi:hypothetical protein